MQMHIAPLFIIVKNWKKSTCASTDEWINKMSYIHTMAYYSYIKWNRLLLYALYLCVQSLSRISLFASPWTADCQAPLSMEFSRQEYWSKLPFPVSGDLLEPGIKPPCHLHWQANSSPLCHLGSPTIYHSMYQSEKHYDKRKKKPNARNHILCDCIYKKWSENVNIWRQKAD